MKKIFLLTLMLALILKCWGQNIAKKDALADIKYLNEAVVSGHPVNYNPAQKVDIESIVSIAENLPGDSLTAFEFRILLGHALFNIGCVHTTIQQNPLAKTTTGYFPFSLMIIDEKLTITIAADSIFIGQQITSINNISSQEIIDNLNSLVAGDGGSNAFARRYFELFSSALVATYFNDAVQYEINTADSLFNVEASEKFIQEPDLKTTGEVLFTNNRNTFSVKEGTSILKITKFSKNDRKFFKRTFKETEEKGLENLVIDLRDNTGGNRKAVVNLAKYLIDTTFGYAILQPNLQTKPYLNKKGRKFYTLSKIKYNIGNAFKGRKTELGRQFSYSYKPHKKVHKGRVFVITNGFTASSSTMLTSWLKQHTNATFAGTQAGGGYNGNNGGSFPYLTLPNSGVVLKFPAYRLVLDPNSEMREGITPDIEITPNIPDIVSGKDAVMEYIFGTLMP